MAARVWPAEQIALVIDLSMSSEMSEIGKYEQKQIYCKSKIISWSHNSRFEFARRLVGPFSGLKLLDYGCGDGTFLKQVFDKRVIAFIIIARWTGAVDYFAYLYAL